MKLHDFIVNPPAGEAQKLRDLGKALIQPSPLRVSEVARKPVASEVTRNVSGMEAAIAEIIGDHKMVHNKMKNYD